MGKSILTEREHQVLHLVADCYGYKEIMQELGIALKTTNRHIENIMRKTGIHAKEKLILYAQQHGYGKRAKPA